jgi:hypothetical protein
MTLDAGEFMRRFLMHVLPKGFRRIRHFGFLANACRAGKACPLSAPRSMFQNQRASPNLPTTAKRYAMLTGQRIASALAAAAK